MTFVNILYKQMIKRDVGEEKLKNHSFLTENLGKIREELHLSLIRSIKKIMYSKILSDDITRSGSMIMNYKNEIKRKLQFE